MPGLFQFSLLHFLSVIFFDSFSFPWLLQNSNLSISALASVLHLKQFLINKLHQDLEARPAPSSPSLHPSSSIVAAQMSASIQYYATPTHLLVQMAADNRTLILWSKWQAVCAWDKPQLEWGSSPFFGVVLSCGQKSLRIAEGRRRTAGRRVCGCVYQRVSGMVGGLGTCSAPPLTAADGGVQADDIVIACRGIVLRNDQSVFSVRRHIWPASHPVRTPGWNDAWRGMGFAGWLGSGIATFLAKIIGMREHDTLGDLCLQWLGFAGLQQFQIWCGAASYKYGTLIEPGLVEQRRMQSLGSRKSKRYQRNGNMIIAN
jgi:hypothetical protein